MRIIPRSLHALAGVALCLTVLLITGKALAAGSGPAVAPVARVIAPVDESRRVTLKGHVHSALREAVDLGAADPARQASRMVLVLKSSDSQQRELEALLAAQHNPDSAEWRQWLTPAQFAARFGLADSDRAAVRSWLVSHGLQVDEEPAGGRSIVFSGTLGQISEAFGVHMHRYQWRGETHIAASGNPSIPAALATVVSGLASLHDFRHQPLLVRAGTPPLDTLGGAHYLAPADFGIIYNASGAWSAGDTGTGRSIAVLGRSSVVAADLSNFRSAFGLAARAPTIVSGGGTPGVVSGDELESDLDLEWSAAIAPAASLVFVTTASTGLSDGIDLSAQYAVSSNVADIISLSYGSCESSGDVSGGTTFYNQLWQQAAAQGISVLVSSGDSGAAGCDGSNQSSASGGLGVNALCSSPYSTCVGGTQFSADVAAPGSYWNSSNAGGSQASALSYIGEAAWNESGSVAGGSGLYASGGGASRSFAKPWWQYSPGIPSDGARDVPDMALNAAGNHDGYLIYTSDGYASSTLVIVGGTSAAAPSMAGIAAIVAQAQGGRLGNLNPVLYALSASQGNSSSGAFHRITSGNNSVPGQVGFAASSSNPQFSEVSGLGSIDVGQLLSAWRPSRPPVALDPQSAVVKATASVGTAQLTVAPGVAWISKASSSGNWLSVTPASGSGPAILTFAASTNTGSVARTGTVTVGGLTLTVVQAAGNPATPAAAALSSAALTFPATVIGSMSASQRLLLSNTGGASLSLTALSLSGAATADFVSSGSCAAAVNLSGGASCYLDLGFHPQASGTRTATLTVNTSAGAVSVTLTGNGSVAPSSGTDGDIPTLPPWAALLLAAALALLAARTRESTAPRS